MDIEQQALHTYKKNMAYLQESHASLHKKIIAFEQSLSKGLARENLSLEYKDEGYFDIKDLATNEWLYGEDSRLYSQNLTNFINFKKSEGTFHGIKEEFVSDNDAAIIDISVPKPDNKVWVLAKIINYHNNKVPHESYLKQVMKFIILNTGLGLHIPFVVAKTGAKILFIQEGNLEIFRLSLFVADYSEIAKGRKIFFSIAEEELQEREIFIQFLTQETEYNFHIKYLPFFKDYFEKLKKLQFYVHQQAHVRYPYNAMLLRNVAAPKYIYEDYSFISLHKRRTLPLFSQNPMLIVAAGPSSKREVEWLQKNKDKFIIVSPITACSFLHNHGIKPNIVVQMDPHYRLIASLLEELPHDYFDQCITILSSNVDEEIVKKFNKKNVFCIEQGTYFKAGFIGLSTSTVGEYTFALLLMLGVKELYLLGIDYALDPDTFVTHAGHHPHHRTIQPNHQENNGPSVQGGTIMYVPGNFQKSVPTFTIYYESLPQFNLLSKHLKAKDQMVYNLSHGAKLGGMIPKKTSELELSQNPILHRKTLFEQLHESLYAISEHKATRQDKKILQREIKGTKALIKSIENFSKKPKSPNTYIQELVKFQETLSGKGSNKKLQIYLIYATFFKAAYPYVFDILMTQGIQYESIMEELDGILTKQTTKIAMFYVENLERYIQKEEI